MSNFINEDMASNHVEIDDLYDKIEYPEGKDYKTYRGFRYHLNFPDEWILYEKEDTGRACANCVGRPSQFTGLPDMTGFAMWRGIILGYCSNCAHHDYTYERGRGFMGDGVEHPNTAVSAFDMYLGEIDFETLGDLDMNPDNTLENQEKTLEEVKPLVIDNEYYDEMAYEMNSFEEYDHLKPSESICEKCCYRFPSYTADSRCENCNTMFCMMCDRSACDERGYCPDHIEEPEEEEQYPDEENQEEESDEEWLDTKFLCSHCHTLLPEVSAIKGVYRCLNCNTKYCPCCFHGINGPRETHNCDGEEDGEVFSRAYDKATSRRSKSSPR